MSEPQEMKSPEPEKRARAPWAEVRRSGSREILPQVPQGLTTARTELAVVEKQAASVETLSAARDRLRSDVQRLERSAVPGNTAAARELLSLRLEALERSVGVEVGAGRLPLGRDRSNTAAARDGTVLRPFVTLSPVRRCLAGLAKALHVTVEELLLGAAYELQDRYGTFKQWLKIWNNLSEDMINEPLMPDRVAITVGMGHGEYRALVTAVAQDHLRRANEALLFERAQEMLHAAFEWGKSDVSAKDRVEIMRAAGILPTPQAGGGLSVNVNQQVGMKMEQTIGGPSFADFMRENMKSVKVAANEEAGTDHRAWRPDDKDDDAVEAEIIEPETAGENEQ